MKGNIRCRMRMKIYIFTNITYYFTKLTLGLVKYGRKRGKIGDHMYVEDMLCKSPKASGGGGGGRQKNYNVLII